MIITVTNQRGGAGKTTTALAIAQASTYKGKKALIVDADPQGSATLLTGASASIPGVADILKGNKPIIQETEAGYIIGTGVNLETVTKPKDSFLLLDALEPLKKQFKTIVIDTAPGKNALLVQSFAASDGVIIPITADSVSFNGFINTLKDIETLNNGNFIEVNILGAILTRYNGRSTLSKEFKELFTTQCANMGVKGAKTAVRDSVKIQEAQTLRKSIYKHAPNSAPALDYLDVFKELKLF